jgi:hypothetical protein
MGLPGFFNLKLREVEPTSAKFRKNINRNLSFPDSEAKDSEIADFFSPLQLNTILKKTKVSGGEDIWRIRKELAERDDVVTIRYPGEKEKVLMGMYRDDLSRHVNRFILKELNINGGSTIVDLAEEEEEDLRKEIVKRLHRRGELFLNHKVVPTNTASEDGEEGKSYRYDGELLNRLLSFAKEEGMEIPVDLIEDWQKLIESRGVEN